MEKKAIKNMRKILFTLSLLAIVFPTHSFADTVVDSNFSSTQIIATEVSDVDHRYSRGTEYVVGTDVYFTEMKLKVCFEGETGVSPFRGVVKSGSDYSVDIAYSLNETTGTDMVTCGSGYTEYSWLFDGIQLVEGLDYYFVIERSSGSYDGSKYIETTYLNYGNGILDAIYHYRNDIEWVNGRKYDAWQGILYFSTTGEAPNVPPAAVAIVPATTNFATLTNFDASSSTDSDGTIESYFWYFGDGATSSDEVATHAYTNFGEYDWSLIVTDNATDTDEVFGSIFVGLSPSSVDVTVDSASTTEAVYAAGRSIQLYLSIFLLLAFGIIGYKFTRIYV